MTAGQCCEFQEIKCEMSAQAAVRSLSGTRDPFRGRRFLHRWRRGGFWSDFKHIAFILRFIIITCAPPQIIRHSILKVEDPWAKRFTETVVTTYNKHKTSFSVAGPALPPNYKSSSSESSDSDEDSSSLSEEGNQESEEDDTGPPARSVRFYIKW